MVYLRFFAKSLDFAMIRDFIRIKNIKSSDFLYTIATFLNYNSTSKLSQRF